MAGPGNIYARNLECAKKVIGTLATDILQEYQNALIQIAKYSKIDDSLNINTKEKLSLIEQIIAERSSAEPILNTPKQE